MDPLFVVDLCRLCFGNESLVNIFDHANVNIADILNKHIGEVSQIQF